MQGELKCFGRGVSDDLNKRVYEIWRGEVGDKWTGMDSRRMDSRKMDNYRVDKWTAYFLNNNLV